MKKLFLLIALTSTYFSSVHTRIPLTATSSTHALAIAKKIGAVLIGMHGTLLAGEMLFVGAGWCTEGYTDLQKRHTHNYHLLQPTRKEIAGSFAIAGIATSAGCYTLNKSIQYLKHALKK